MGNFYSHMRIQFNRRSEFQYAPGAWKNILYDLLATPWWASLPSNHVVWSAPAVRVCVTSRPTKSHKINGMEVQLVIDLNSAGCLECASTTRLLYQPTVLHRKIRQAFTLHLC